jgi:hypothetical protein
MREDIKVGYQAFVSDGGEEFGAVRQVSPNDGPVLVVYVENAGDFLVPLEAAASVHAQKVVLECGKLDMRLRRAIGHAHDAEKPGH